MTDRDAIERFLEMMTAQAGAAANTLAADRRDLTLASEVLGGALADADAEALVGLAAPRHSRAGGNPDTLPSRLSSQVSASLDPRLRGDDEGAG